MAEWIWIPEDRMHPNQRVCFSAQFEIDKDRVNSRTVLRIGAVTRYLAWINGIFLGYGPIRSAEACRVLDSYELASYLRPGMNNLSVEVWDYGLSTYQTICVHPGLYYQLTCSGRIIAESGTQVVAAPDAGHISHAPKRNVNTGYTDYYDARRFDSHWVLERKEVEQWEHAVAIPPEATRSWQLSDRPIRNYYHQNLHPAAVEAVQDVKRGCQVVSVNCRDTFFPGRRDADSFCFCGILGAFLHADHAMEGRIAFPNRMWNGILGNFSIDETQYSVTDADRSLPVHLTAGRHLFLIKIQGKFDDLFCHIEFCFPEPIRIEKQGGHSFFAVGPADVNQVHADGIKDADEGQAINNLGKDTVWKELMTCTDFNELFSVTNLFSFIPEEDVMWNMYLLSLVQNEKVAAEYAEGIGNEGILWDNDEYTRIDPPIKGDYRRVILDFGRECVGRLSFTLKAAYGAVIDFYGFENYYQRQIDYTVGLNNGIRYIAGEGWQNYTGMARIGLRYLAITVRGTDQPVLIRDLHLIQELYPEGIRGDFECSDETLNRIFRMCRETNALCTEDSFTDSPVYEQAFWIGDAMISSKVNAWLYGDYDYEIHNQELAVSGLANSALMNALTPTDWTTSIPMWTMNWIYAVFDTAEMSGDESSIERSYPAMKKVLEYYSRFVSAEKGFSISSWNLIDWAPMDIGNNGTIAAQEGLLANCYSLLEAYAKSRHRDADAAWFADRYRVLENHINSFLWNDQRKAYYDGWTEEKGYSSTYSVQTHLLLNFCHLVPEDRIELVTGYVLDPPEDFVQVGSPFILYYLYEMAIQNGRKDYVFRDIRKRWTQMLSYGSGTCWEVFPGFYENSRTRSYCHSWSSSPAYFMIRYLSGIRVLEPGFNKIVLEPLPENLDWARVKIPTPHGRIHFEWYRRRGKLELRLEIPEGIEYSVPDEYWDKITIRILNKMPAYK